MRGTRQKGGCAPSSEVPFRVGLESLLQGEGYLTSARCIHLLGDWQWVTSLFGAGRGVVKGVSREGDSFAAGE